MKGTVVVSISVPMKIIAATAREVFIANSRLLYTKSCDITYSLKLRSSVVIISTPTTQQVVLFDDFDEALIADALAMCYIYDIEVEPAYMVQIEIWRVDPLDKTKRIVDHSVWIGRDGHNAWIAVTVGVTRPSVRFNLNKIDS